VANNTTPACAPVTLRDIAERCQVSKSTVAQAMRGNSRLAKATVARVLEVAAEMGYDPTYHEGARRLAFRKQGRRVLNHLIAVFYPRAYLRIPFYVQTFLGIMETLGDAGFGVCVGYVQSETITGSHFTFPQVLRRGDIDGVICAGGGMLNAEMMHELRGSAGFGTRPIITLYDRTPGCSIIDTDNADGAYQAMHHLLALGHQHIMFVHYYIDTEGPQPYGRYRACCLALEEAGYDPLLHLHPFKFNPDWVDPQTAHHTIDDLRSADEVANDAADALVQYLQVHPEVTAIMAINDAFALHAWYALHRAGYRVPDDVSIVGFDDTDPMRDERGNNMLTTVSRPLEEVGRAAAQQILNQIADDDAETTVILPTRLIVRHSTAPRKKGIREEVDH